MRGARLDLDERRTDGIRIANAAGSWMCLVNGFAGMRIQTRTGRLSFDPQLPVQWEALAFTMHFRGRLLRVELSRKEIVFALQGEPLAVGLRGRKITVFPNAPVRRRLAPRRDDERETG
jgi:trehalose/maltose hydrolase-like predicted phosphorylase